MVHNGIAKCFFSKVQAYTSLEVACLAFLSSSPSDDNFELTLMKELNYLGKFSMGLREHPNTEEQLKTGENS